MKINNTHGLHFGSARGRQGVTAVLVKGVVVGLVMVAMAGWGLWLRHVGVGKGIYAVNGHSMEPTIPAGAMIVTQKQVTYKQGEVITRRQDDGQLVTHRIMGGNEQAGQMWYRLKGDGNDSSDAVLVDPKTVVGKVRYVIPVVGYVIIFAKTRMGMVLLVVVPALLLMIKATKDLLDQISLSLVEGQQRRVK